MAMETQKKGGGEERRVELVLSVEKGHDGRQ